MKAANESGTLRACIDYFRLLGWWCARFNSGGVYDKNGQFVRFNSAKGCSDLIAIAPGGLFLAVECNHGKNKQTANQMQFQREVEAAGAIYLVVYDVLDLQKQLMAIGLISPV